MKKLAALLIAALSVGMQGCFTISLWGGDFIDEDVPANDTVETTMGWEFPDESGDSMTNEEILGLILLTPVAIALDCLTLPAQAWFFGWDEEDWTEE